jgi:hypothetical protein
MNVSLIIISTTSRASLSNMHPMFGDNTSGPFRPPRLAPRIENPVLYKRFKVKYNDHNAHPPFSGKGRETLLLDHVFIKVIVAETGGDDINGNNKKLTSGNGSMCQKKKGGLKKSAGNHSGAIPHPLPAYISAREKGKGYKKIQPPKEIRNKMVVKD